MAMPISLAARRRRHGVLGRRVERQVVGVTWGEGSLDQAHVAKFWRRCDDVIVILL